MKIKFWLRFLLAETLICAVFVFYFSYTYKVVPAASKVSQTFDRNGLVLVIDPGHGGEDGGAVSITGTSESEINLAIALKTEQLAAFYGIVPVMTRNSDNIDYPDDAVTTRARKVADQKNRVALINSIPNAVLISIHQNKYTTSGPSGCQVFFAPTEGSEDFAKYMQDIFLTQASSGNRRTAAKISDSIYLMNSISCPALLIECGFISNTTEAYLLEDSNYQTKLAAIIAGGFIGFSEQLAEVYLEA